MNSSISLFSSRSSNRALPGIAPLALSLVVPVLLIACGGGGGDSTPAPQPSAPDAPDLANITNTVMAIEDQAITAIVLTNNGGGQLNALDATTPGCSASTNLPAGLEVLLTSDNNSCQITGTPTEATTGTVTVMVTATNATGTDPTPAEVMIVINPAPPTTAPDLANITNTVMATEDQAITAIVFTNNGGGQLNALDAATPGCSASADLPAGLVVALATGGDSCQITGTPTEATTDTVTVMVTATNAIGTDPTPATVSIVVAEAPPITVSLGISTLQNKGDTNVTLRLLSRGAGRIFTLILPRASTAPASGTAVKEAVEAMQGVARGVQSVLANTPILAYVLSGLESGTEYTAYLAYEEDGTGSLDFPIVPFEFTTRTPSPVSEESIEETDLTDVSVEFSPMSSISGTLYILINPGASALFSGETVRQAVEAMEGAARATVPLTANTAATISLDGLKPDTFYTTLFAFEDGATGNLNFVVLLETFATMVPGLAELRLIDGFQTGAGGVLEFVRGTTYHNGSSGLGSPGDGRIFFAIDRLGEGFSIRDCELLSVNGDEPDANDPAKRLPAGLDLEPESFSRGCALVGTPTAATASRTYRFSVFYRLFDFSDEGQSDLTIDIDIAVVDP